MKGIGFDEQRMLIVDILRKYADYCEENQLVYTLAYGTLLGAIRHNGLIPWDDDIDVFMPRDDYNRFIQMYDANPIHNIVLNCVEKDGDYPFLFAKLSMKGTIAKKNGVTFGFGVYIDVFPLDGMGNDYEKAIKKRKKQIRYVNNGYSLFKNKYLTKVWDKYCSLRQKGYEKYWYIKKYCKNNYKDSTYISQICGWEKGIFCKDIFFPPILESFEKNYYYIPNGFDSFLSSSYGNYLELPPKEKRVSLHEYEYYWE